MGWAMGTMRGSVMGSGSATATDRACGDVACTWEKA